ncbi:hypothetical protein AAHH71_00160 [Bacillus toyonensis]
MNNKTLRDEYKLVILLAKKDLNSHEREYLVDLLHKNLEWDKVIGMLEMHRVAGIAWLNLKQYFLTKIVTDALSQDYTNTLRMLIPHKNAEQTNSLNIHL